jgi:hypothetical protein
MKLALLKRVESPVVDPVEAAVKLIEEERLKTRYDSKEKWMCFSALDTTDVVEHLAFLTVVRAKLLAANRKQYGRSRTLETHLVTGPAPMLYVHTERY